MGLVPARRDSTPPYKNHRCKGTGQIQLVRWAQQNASIGRLARLSLKATDGIAKLGAGAESESVQLRAWRAVLADQMAVAKFSDLEDRMTEIEEQLSARTGHTNQAR